MVTRLRVGWLGFDSHQVLGIFPSPPRPERPWGPRSLLSNGYRRVLAPEVNRPGRETDHSPPSSAKFKNAWSYTSTPHYVFMTWCLVKLRDNFTLYSAFVKLVAACQKFFYNLIFHRNNFTALFGGAETRKRKSKKATNRSDLVIFRFLRNKASTVRFFKRGRFQLYAQWIW
jgi:hypothetical protein